MSLLFARCLARGLGYLDRRQLHYQSRLPGLVALRGVAARVA